MERSEVVGLMSVEGQASRRRQVGNGDDDHASQVICERQAIVEANVFVYCYHCPLDGLLQRLHFCSMAMVTSRQLRNPVPEATIRTHV